MQNRRKEATITEDILLHTEVSLPGHANPYGIHQHFAYKSFARITNNCYFYSSLHEHIFLISRYSYHFQKSV